MFRFLLHFSFFCLSFLTFGQHSVTFTVDLSPNTNFNPNIHQVYLSGAREDAPGGLANLPAWPMPGSNSSLLMNSNGNNTYSLTISNMQLGTYAYKYFLVANGQASWNFGEWSETINRVITVQSTDVQTNDLWGFVSNPVVDLKINEIMASNGQTLADEDDEFEDWIEIFNAGNQAVNLNGFGLSDSPSTPLKWTFPSVFILPNQYLIVWASGKNRKPFNQPLHTNFSISNSGESIILSDLNGQIIDLAPAVQHQTDISFGRFPDASGEFKYFSNPSPGQINQGQSYESLSAPLQFSIPEGYYSSSVSISITSADIDAIIRYTLDGSEPNENSPIYSEPLTMQHLADVPNVFSNIPTNNLSPGPPYFEGWQPPLGNVYKINVLRAKSFNALKPPALSYNSTYIIEPQLNNRFTLPLMSLTSDYKHLFDNETGMYVFGNSGNYWNDWERPGNFTYFNRDGSVGFNENAGFQLNGNTTRSRPRKAIRVVFRNLYGNSWLDYPVFENNPTNQYKRLILRNGGNDWGNSLIRDGIAQVLARDLHIEVQSFQPTIVFINGEYWGIHDMRERYSTHFFEAKYGVLPTEITVMENNAEFKRGNPAGVSHYQNLVSFIQNNDLSNQQNYQTVTQLMDIESFIDFQIAHIFPKNTDWPGNNVLYWRFINDTYDPNAGMLDGRWRWMLFDLDFGFDLNFNYVPFLNQGASHNTLDFAMQQDGPAWPNPAWSTLFLRKLTGNESFKKQFTNRYCDLLNTVYHPDFVVFTIDSIKNLLLPEMQEHINRWRSPVSVSSWLDEIEGMKTFAQQRSGFQYQHLQSVFGFGNKYKLSVDVDDSERGYVQVNSIALKSETLGIGFQVYPWEGEYLNGCPIDLTAIPNPGYVFSHWSGFVSDSASSIVIDPSNSVQLKAHFKPIDASDYELLHFWFFGTEIPNDAPLSSVAPTFNTGHAILEFESCLQGYPFNQGHPNWRKASMERRNSPTDLNYIEEGNIDIPYPSSNMRGIQIKQPFRNDTKENSVFLKFSTKGYENIEMRLAIKDEDAVQGLSFDYKNPTINNDFISNDVISNHSLDGNYQIVQFTMNQVTSANDADTLVIRIRFSGNNLTADNGGRVTFNNVSILGTKISEIDEDPEVTDTPFMLFPNPAVGSVFISSSELLSHVELHDVSGKFVAIYQTTGNESLNIEGLASGLYFLTTHTAIGTKKTTRLQILN